MKRFVAILLAIIAVFFLASCTKKEEEPQFTMPRSTPKPTADNDGQPSDGSKEGDGVIRIGVALSQQNQYTARLAEDLEASAQKQGAKLEVVYAGNDSMNQLKQVESLCNSGNQVIIVDIVSEMVTKDLMMIARDHPVIFIDNMPDESVFRSGKDAYVGSNYAQAGELQADYLTKLMLNESRIDYVILGNATDKAKAVLSAFEGRLRESGIKLNLVLDCSDYSDNEAMMSKVLEIYEAGTPLDAIVCSDDEIALSVLKLREDIKLEKYPMIFGVGGLADAARAISYDEMMMTVTQDTIKQADICINLAISGSKGLIKEKNVIVPLMVIDKSNMNDVFR